MKGTTLLSTIYQNGSIIDMKGHKNVEDLWDSSAIDSLASENKELLEGQNVRKAEAGLQRYSLT